MYNDIIVSVNSFIVRNNNIISGVLNIFDSRYEFRNQNGKVIQEHSYNEDELEIRSGRRAVSFEGLFSRECFFIQLEDVINSSYRFFINEALINNITEAIKDKQISKKLKEPFEIQEMADAQKSIISYVIFNPYRTIGVSVVASKKDIDTSSEKIIKLCRLNAVDSYKASIDIPLMPNVVRDIGTCNNAVSALQNHNHKWFWFEDKEIAERWYEADRHLEIKTYDNFLARYLYALTVDNRLRNIILWKSIFEFIESIVIDNRKELIASRTERFGNDAISEFIGEIFKPLNDNIKNNIEGATNLLCILEDNRSPFFAELIIKAETAICEWQIEYETKMMEFCAKYQNVEEISESDVDLICCHGTEYVKEAYVSIGKLFNVVGKANPKLQKCYASVKSTLWSLMACLLKQKGDDKSSASIFGDFVYCFCENEDRKKIRSAFGFDRVVNSFNESDDDDLVSVAIRYMYGITGRSVDYQAAFSMLKKASDNNNGKAQYYLGLCYLEGKGCFRNEENAFDCFNHSAENDYEDGVIALAKAYYNGTGVVCDFEKALQLLYKVKDSENEDVAKLITEIEEKVGPGGDKSAKTELHKTGSFLSTYDEFSPVSLIANTDFEIVFLGVIIANNKVKLRFCVKNNTGKQIDIHAKDISLNGVEIDQNVMLVSSISGEAIVEYRVSEKLDLEFNTLTFEIEVLDQNNASIGSTKRYQIPVDSRHNLFGII